MTCISTTGPFISFSIREVDHDLESISNNSKLSWDGWAQGSIMLKNIHIESFRSSRWFKPALGVAGVFLSLLLFLFFAPILIDVNTYRGHIIEQLERRIGRSVKLGEMDLSILPSVKFRVDEVVIVDDPQFTQAEFVKARSVKLQIELWSLLKGAPEVSGIELDAPDVTLIRSKDNKWNWSTLKPLQSSSQESAPAPFDLLARDGRFTLIDRSVDPTVERKYTDINIALDGFSSRQAFDFVIGLTIPGEKAGKIEIEGQAGPIDSGDRSGTPIDARAHLQDVDLSGLESLLGVMSNRAGRLTMDLKISGNLTESINGSGKLTGSQLQMTRTAKPIDISNADLAFTGDGLRADNLTARLGSSQINGWAQVKNFEQPFASFDLKANQLSVVELQQVLASEQKSQTTNSDASPMRAEGQLAVGKLILEGLTATDMQSKVSITDQVITLAPLSLKMYDGVYQGSARIDQSGGPPEISLDGRFNGLDINQFLSSSGQKSEIYGRADGSLNVRGHGGDSSGGLAKSLVGNGSIAINDGKFASFDLMKQIEALGRLINLPVGGVGTTFRSFKTNLRFDRGRMTTDPLQLVMDGLSVTGQGVMQLGDAPVVDYALLARLSPELTKRVLPQSVGTETGSLLQTVGKFTSKLGAFFIEQDAMVVPIRMSGPLGRPDFGLNSSVLQLRAKDRLVDSFTDQINKGFGKESGTEPGKNTGKPKPADLLKGILDNIKPREKR